MKLSIIFLAMFALTIGYCRAAQVTYSECPGQPAAILRTEEEVTVACLDCCNSNFDTFDTQCGDNESCNDENANEYGECVDGCTNECIEASYRVDFECIFECGKDRDCIETCKNRYEASVAMCNNARAQELGRLQQMGRIQQMASLLP